MSGPPAHRTSGSLDLDLLDEYYPVDNFFSTYVDELAQRASKRHPDAGDLLLQPEPKQMRLAGASGTPLAASLGSPFGLADGPLMGDAAAGQQQLGGLNGLAGAMAMQQAAALPGGGVQLASCLLGGAGNNSRLLHQQQQALLQQQLLAAGGGLPGLLPGHGAAMFPAATPSGFAGGLAVPAGLPGAQLTLPASARVAAASGMVPASAAAPIPVPVRSTGDADSGGAYSDDQVGGVDSKAGGGKKSVKQQEANKVAQQRYRERKKAKFHEMEATIEALRQQLQTLQALQSRNAILEGQNTDLESKLVEREGEIERLKVELDRQSDETLLAARATAAGAAAAPAERDGSGASSAAGTGVAAPGTAAAAKAGSAAGAGAAGAGACCGPGSSGGGADDECRVACDVLPRNLSGIDFKSGFSDQVARLRAFVEERNLRSADPSGESLPRPLLQELSKLVGRSCQLCQAALRVEGVRVIDLISRDPASMSGLAGDEAENRRWRRALEVMKLSPSQQQQLLMLRQSHLAKMRSIYEERQRLNLEAMALMLPHQSRNPYEDNTVEGRLSNISSCGYLAIARSNAELGTVLDRVKDNLRREQRAVMDINCVTISKILSPLQAALYMIELYPVHCDALALTNVLARSVELGMPPAHCPNADTCPKVAAGACNGSNCATLGLDPAGSKPSGRGASGGPGGACS